MSERLTLRCLILLSATLLFSVAGFYGQAWSADESLDSLLNEANRALGKPSKSGNSSESKVDDSSQTQSPKPKHKIKNTSKTKEETSTAPSASMTSPEKPANESLKPLDSESVTQILALDLQAKERERITRTRGLSVRIGYANDRIPAVYEVEKDDDTFTMNDSASLNGASLDALVQAPIQSLGQDRGFEGAPFWGITVGAGLVQGPIQISRRGVFNEDRTYPYQVVTTDGGLALGWGSNLGASESSGYQLWLTGGYGADIIRQMGDGQYDTFSEVFHGQVLSFGTSWRSNGGYELYLQLKQRGQFSFDGKSEPTRTRVAGRMIMVGFGMLISG